MAGAQRVVARKTDTARTTTLSTTTLSTALRVVQVSAMWVERVWLRPLVVGVPSVAGVHAMASSAVRDCCSAHPE